MAKRPSFQFYPGDWLRDTALRTCSVAARGLWIEMICLMHEGQPYGHLKVGDKIIDAPTLARMVGSNTRTIKSLLGELLHANVCEMLSDQTIISRRMVRDEEVREKRAAGGSKGGNPKLVDEYNKPGFIYVLDRDSDEAVKIGISIRPSKRLYKVRKQFPNDQIDLRTKVSVPDMGAAEARIHKALSVYKISGEWFLLDERGEAILEGHLATEVKVNSKEIGTPSSASASSSSSAKNLETPGGVSSGGLFGEDGSRIDWEAVIVRWNKLAKEHDRPKLKNSLNESRRKHYRARLKATPNFWEVLEREIPRLGEHARSAKNYCTFPWLISSQEKLDKLAEGNYRDDDRPSPGGKPNEDQWPWNRKRASDG